jgi:hypothetical protein
LRRRRGDLAVQPQRRQHPGRRGLAWPYNAFGATKAATSGPGVLASVIWTFVVANAIVLVILELRARRHGAPSVIGPR